MKIKNHFSKWLALLLVLLAPVMAQAQYNFNVNPGGTTITITGYTGPGGAVDIPTTFAGYIVTSLGAGAFISNNIVTSVTIPNSVTNIAARSFYRCGSLTNITIPNNVISIGDGAFGHTKLESVHIPASVLHLGINPFLGCRYLSDITVDNGNPAYESAYYVDNLFYYYYVLFNKSRTVIVAFTSRYVRQPGVALPSFPSSVTNIAPYAFKETQTDIIFPPNTVIIGEGAFEQSQVLALPALPQLAVIGEYAFANSQIEHAFIPGTVKNISDFAFHACINLRTAIIANGVTNIGTEAFEYAPLGSIIIPDSVKTMGEHVFNRCFSLTNAVIGGGLGVIPNGSFLECTALRSVLIGHGVTTIGPEAFLLCRALTSVTIPNSVTTIHEAAFSNCSALQNIPLSGNLTFIGDYAFEFTAVTNVVIPNSVTNLGQRAFHECTSLTNVIIGSGIRHIKSQTFIQTALRSVIIPDSVTNIGHSAFYECSSLASVTLGNSVTHIGVMAFGQTAISSITIPDSVKSINGSFSYCTALTNVVIGNGVVEINSAFAYCPVLRSVSLGNSVALIGPEAFAHCPQLKDLILPPSVTRIAQRAFQSCSSLFNLTIPPGVTDVYAEAFLDCSNLTNLFFSGAAPNVVTFNLLKGATNTTVYYPLAAAGWNPPIETWQGRPAVPWDPTSKLLLSLSGGVVTVTTFIGSNGFVNIPASLGGFPIKTIGTSAFAGSGITGVTIPEGVLTIGDFAFQGCLGLTTLNLPDSLISIGAGGPYGQSFSLCANLVSVTFGTNFTTFGNSIFTGCSSLQSLYFRGTGVPYNPPQNYFFPSTTVYYPVGGNAATWSSTFAEAMVAPWDPNGNFLVQLSGDNITITGYAGSGGAASIPNQIGGFPVIAIAPSAFQNKLLTSITIPDSVTSIGDSAFAQCASLGAVTMGNGVTNIGAMAFYQCTGLNHINFGSGVTTIGDYAMAECNMLSIFIPASVTSIGANCFSGTPAHSIYFKGNAPTVPGILFFYGTSATIYYVPGTTGWGPIGAQFAGRPTALWSDAVPCRLVLADGELSVSTYVAINGGPGAAVTIPSMIGGYPVTSIGQSAFPGVLVASITLPDSVLNIGNSAFQGCNFLKNVNLGNGVTNIGQNALNSSGVESLIIPASLESLSLTAFSFANLLNSIYFKGNAPSIDASVLSDTSATLYYTLGSTGWGILGSSFAGRPTGLWSPEVPCHIQFSSGQVSIDRYIGSGGAVNLPSAIGGYPVTKILTSAFDVAALTSLTIPASVTNMESVSINSCLELTSIYFKGSAPAFGANAIVGTPATLYYLHADASWSSSIAGRPAYLWNPLLESSGSGLGVQGNQFLFNITGTADIPIAVESCTDLANPVWERMYAGTLTGGSLQFDDPLDPSAPARFYRVSAP